MSPYLKHCYKRSHSVIFNNSVNGIFIKVVSGSNIYCAGSISVVIEYMLRIGALLCCTAQTTSRQFRSLLFSSVVGNNISELHIVLTYDSRMSLLRERARPLFAILMPHGNHTTAVNFRREQKWKTTPSLTQMHWSIIADSKSNVLRIRILLLIKRENDAGTGSAFREDGHGSNTLSVSTKQYLIYFPPDHHHTAAEHNHNA